MTRTYLTGKRHMKTKVVCAVSLTFVTPRHQYAPAVLSPDPVDYNAYCFSKN